MKKIIRSFFVIIILVMIFIILNYAKLNKNIFDDIIIFRLFDYIGNKNEYEIAIQDTVEIDVFTTINNSMYKKIAPGSKGSFIIKFKKPVNTNYQLEIKEKTSKPQNLIFIIGNKKYISIEEMEEEINKQLKNTEKLTINWEWKYYIDDFHDMQDTRDGEKAQKYIFEVKAIIR